VTSPRSRALAALLCTALCAGAAWAGPDWEALADTKLIEVITTDADGSPREITIWFVVVDGQGFIRTGETRWWENLGRDPHLVLRIDDTDYPLRADPIRDEAFRTRIREAFREKYGWQDRIFPVLRGQNAHIMHMAPR